MDIEIENTIENYTLSTIVEERILVFKSCQRFVFP